MKGVILAGGKGSRMSPLTLLTPKPLVPIMNIPVIDLCISWLKAQGITEIAITIHHLATKIQEHCGDGSKYGVKLSYFYENSPMGTAGGLRALNEFIDGTFVVISSDIVSQFSLQEAVQFHKKSHSECTVITTPLSFPEQYGLVIKDRYGKIRHFIEKPPKHLVCSDQINTGIYIMEPSILESIPSDQSFDFSHDLFPLLIQKDAALYCYSLEGYWIDIGQIHTYHQVHRDYFTPLFECNGLGGYKEIKRGVFIGANCNIDPLCTFEGPILIGEGSNLGPNTFVGANTVIGRNCVIEGDCFIEDSILWDEVKIQKDVHIINSVISSTVLVENAASIMDNTVITNDNQIRNQTQRVSQGEFAAVTNKDKHKVEEEYLISEYSLETLETKIPFDAIVTITKIQCPMEQKSRMVRLLIESMIDNTIDITMKDGIQLHFSQNRWIYVFPYEYDEHITIYTHAESIEVAKEMAYECRNQIMMCQGV